MSRFRITVGLVAAVVVTLGTTCRRPVQLEETETTTRPAPAPPAPPGPGPEPPERTAPTQPATRPTTRPTPGDVRVRSIAAARSGWLAIDQLYDDVEGGWATGDVDRTRNRIMIETENVKQFAINLQGLGLNWDRRVVLQINDRAMELTRKRHPLVRFRQTPTGGWEVVK